MGLMRFICPADRITEETAQQAYLSGYDRTPWMNRFRLLDGELQMEREASESGNLTIPWEVEDRGRVSLTTSTLMERPEPYHLPLELARGKIGQVRNQLNEWQAMGLEIPPPVRESLDDAVGHLAQAAVVEHGSKRSNHLSEQAICSALEAADQLATAYSEQVLATRKQGAQRLRSMLGADIGPSELDDPTAAQYLQAFNAASAPLSWRQIEAVQDHYDWTTSDWQMRWCSSKGLRVFGGPLLRFDQHFLPDWLALYEGDFESLMSAASSMIQAVVSRYRGQVDVWQCAGRVNASDVLLLTEEQKIHMVAQAIELVRQHAPDTPVLVSFDQPWAEYLSRREMDFPPLHFADALVRANLGLSGLVLEINVGYHPGGSLARDPLEFSRLFDYWSLLGVPLFVSLRVPSGRQEAPEAKQPSNLAAGHWTPQVQEEWVDRYVPLLLAKPCVQGVFWGQLCDGGPHDLAHGGLFDTQRRAKPALARLAAIRQEHLA